VGVERGRVETFGRLDNGLRQASDWYLWGPYLSERQWGTVREDYSSDGEAWTYLPHERARTQAYRWGEDGLAGFCDVEQWLCLALALWNGRVRGPDGRRPCFGGVERMQHDPRWRDNLLFAEYFHGDDGAGLGATHQTGWTGLVADIIRRRYGEVESIGDLLRALRDEAGPS
jgi:hypothetical protein